MRAPMRNGQRTGVAPVPQASGGKAMGVGIEKRAVSTVDDAKRKRDRK